MSAVLLDTHVVHWWSAEPARLSRRAASALEDASSLAVAAITWYELARMAARERVVLSVPVRSWLDSLAKRVETLPLTPAIAGTAASLPSSFPGDPGDRLIYATAIEHGMQLVTKDERLRRHRQPRPITIW